MEPDGIEPIVDALLAEGYELSVFDGRYETASRTVIREHILAGMRSAPYDHLIAYRSGRPAPEGWVRLAYDGDGVTVTSSPGLAKLVTEAPARYELIPYDQGFCGYETALDGQDFFILGLVTIGPDGKKTILR